MEEVWKWVVGYEGRYEVSSLGRVRSLKFRSNGGLQIMKTTPNYAGYPVITLGKERKQHRVHVLMLEAFVGPCPEGLMGCHKNDTNDDNRLDNLYWGTWEDNCDDMKRNGARKGERNGRSKLTDLQVSEIARRRHAGELLKTLADEFGVSLVRVSQIAKAA